MSDYVRRGRLAFTLLELCALVVIVVILAGILYSGGANKRQQQIPLQCLQNLKNVGLAFRIWSTDSSPDFPVQRSTNTGGTREFTNVWEHFRTLSNELSSIRALVCPETLKKPATNFQVLQDRHISYFVGLTATEDIPDSFLAGDTGFGVASPVGTNPILITTNSGMYYPKAVHQGTGVICLGDGSVQQLSRVRLSNFVSLPRKEFPATNILLLPR